MKYFLIIAALTFASCASTIFGKEIQIEDCVTRHLKVLAKSPVLPDTYEKVVDSCKAIYTGRP